MTTSGASTRTDPPSTGRIVLLGRPCGNTSTVAAVLRDAGVALAGTILADPASPPSRHPGAAGTPTLHASSPRGATRLLALLQPDLVVAACYPWRLSRQARAAARWGVLNIHPSPLPHGRGPAPVFWVFRNGEQTTGVTIHLMDDGLDSGPILAQQRVAVPEGANAVTLERDLFERGARLVTGLVPGVLAGTIAARPQDDRDATYQPAPTAHDWVMSPLLPAAWAWRFAQGVAPLRGPLMVHSGGTLVPVRNAIAWGDHGAPPVEVPAGALPVQFRPGWVMFEV